MALLTRRNLLKATAVAGAYGAGVGFAGRFGSAQAAGDPTLLEAVMREAAITGNAATQGVLTYQASLPGAGVMPPALRLKRGEPFAAQLKNSIDEPTTIHWHGMRIDNAMDGVPFLTQPYVYPGDTFDYRFTPPDAGTFWYHPHCNTLTQMGHGLTGLLIVEDPKDPVFDAEIALNLRDWRLGGNGQFIEQFKARDAAKAGTYGTVRTANWQVEPVYDAPAGGLVRVRIAVTDVTRIYNLQLEGADALIVAIDGQPVPVAMPLDFAVVSPGQRLDLVVRMPDSEGTVVQLEDIRPSTPKTVASFRSIGASLRRSLDDVPPLAPNPPVEADLSSATEIPLVLSATAENAAKDSICGSLGYSFWAINKKPWPGDTEDPTAPIAELKLGQTYLLNLENVTPHAHPIHLHGMNFQVVSSSTRQVLPLVSDTYLILPDEKVQLALVADNPGDWVFHCHIIEHQKTGMTGYLRVA
ncbi:MULTISPECIES: multicopper oxidase family protein [Alphaproteobacteria]|uniref:Copper oxidase n=2 Tax=Alphaproteobacteria TaxID=28211 RepID=A0A512HGL3_9HYPH|nr:MULTISPECIES: multicopper oxidase family protein [Alphaproteobacteria]GEO84594.1 copper oxidase [Ciceribacter naphthalenivorans]GLR22557.1 copper oxidase [Ciceribacter naphthalenivorans]GLT05413.1 copper oxidase [Sphingomonas psychrolutea]